MTVPIWAPEVSARFSRALLDDADRRLGSAAVTELLAPLGVTRAELDDETGWLSLAFCELLCERVVEKAGSTEILVQAGRAGFSPRVLGFLYALVRALSNTEALFARIAQVASTVNKVARMTIRERSRGRIVIDPTGVPHGTFAACFYNEREPARCQTACTALLASLESPKVSP